MVKKCDKGNQHKYRITTLLWFKKACIDDWTCKPRKEKRNEKGEGSLKGQISNRCRDESVAAYECHQRTMQDSNDENRT